MLLNVRFVVLGYELSMESNEDGFMQFTWLVGMYLLLHNVAEVFLLIVKDNKHMVLQAIGMSLWLQLNMYSRFVREICFFALAFNLCFLSLEGSLNLSVFNAWVRLHLCPSIICQLMNYLFRCISNMFFTYSSWFSVAPYCLLSA